MALVVIDPGLSTTVQDAGRPGFRQWGVPIGGAFDSRSAELANALVGNSSACRRTRADIGGRHVSRDRRRWLWRSQELRWRPRS